MGAEGRQGAGDQGVKLGIKQAVSGFDRTGDRVIDTALLRITTFYGRLIGRVIKAVDFNESRVISTTSALPTPTNDDRGVLRMTLETGASGEDELFLCRMGTASALEWQKIN